MIIGVIENMIVKALADRIIRACKDEKSFQVIIVIPLKPEFSGTWKDSDELRTVAYLNYSTIFERRRFLLSTTDEWRK